MAFSILNFQMNRQVSQVIQLNFLLLIFEFSALGGFLEVYLFPDFLFSGFQLGSGGFF